MSTQGGDDDRYCGAQNIVPNLTFWWQLICGVLNCVCPGCGMVLGACVEKRGELRRTFLLIGILQFGVTVCLIMIFLGVLGYLWAWIWVLLMIFVALRNPNTRQQMKQVIPKQGTWIQLLCCLMNIFLPGIGTICGGCCEEEAGRRWGCIIFGFLQLITSFFFLGWLWSWLWALLMLLSTKWKHSAFDIGTIAPKREVWLQFICMVLDIFLAGTGTLLGGLTHGKDTDRWRKMVYIGICQFLSGLLFYGVLWSWLWVILMFFNICRAKSPEKN